MTRGDLIRHISSEFGLDKTAASNEQLLMIDWANEGVRDVLLETHCRLEVGDQALVVGEGDYRVDTNIMSVDYRTIQANTTKLMLVSVEDIYDLRSGLGTNVSPDVTRFAAEGDLLMVWPTPAQAATIRYVYIAKPTEMTSDAHDLADVTYGGLPIYAHHAVLSYMRWRAALYEGSRDLPHTPNDYRTFYDQENVRVRRHARKMRSPSLARAKVGYPDAYRIPRRNDMYPER